MKDRGLFISYAVTLIVQIILNNYLNLSQYVVVCFLPAVIICLPVRYGTPVALVAAFVTGFVADFFSSGMLGLTSCALLPVALTRRGLLNMAFGKEYFNRREDIVSDSQGYKRTNICVALGLALFLLIYIIADGAGTRPAGFNILRLVVSFAVNMLASQAVLAMFAINESNAKWR